MNDRSGEHLGNYILQSQLGKGGFADVYLGEHIHLGTQAAIKVLHTQLGSSDIHTFRTEARIIASLIHPHIVRVLDFGIEGQTPFLVMGYAEGGTLRQRHPKGMALPLSLVVDYVGQVAEALQYAHSEKIIHRDVKPENMLLERRNEILLSDFGIALVAQSSRYQSAEVLAGTLAYMAPEQIQGKASPASDQYSLGIVVYEWLSGDRPFHGGLTELVGQHLSVTPPSLQEKVPTISLEVDRVIQRALAKDPKRRFESVLAFADALKQVSLQRPGSPPFLSSKNALPSTAPALATPPIQHPSETSLLLNIPALLQAFPDTTGIPRGIHVSCLLSWLLFDIIAALLYSSEGLNSVGPLLIASSILFFFWGWVVTQTTGRFRTGVSNSVRGAIAVAMGVWLYLAISYAHDSFGGLLLGLGYGCFLFMIPAWILLTPIGLASSGLGSLIGRYLSQLRRPGDHTV